MTKRVSVGLMFDVEDDYPLKYLLQDVLNTEEELKVVLVSMAASVVEPYDDTEDVDDYEDT